MQCIMNHVNTVWNVYNRRKIRSIRQSVIENRSIIRSPVALGSKVLNIDNLVGCESLVLRSTTSEEVRVNIGLYP